MVQAGSHQRLVRLERRFQHLLQPAEIEVRGGLDGEEDGENIHPRSVLFLRQPGTVGFRQPVEPAGECLVVARRDVEFFG